MTIYKQFNSLKAAMRHQNRLYDRFDHVRLIQAPMFQEAGRYVWDCRNPLGADACKRPVDDRHLLDGVRKG